MKRTTACVVVLVLGLIVSAPELAPAQGLRAGSVATVAGDTIKGFNGDLDVEGKPRSSVGASLSLPWGIVVSSSGTEVFVADNGNHRVRRVNTVHWDIFSVAGNGSADFRGDDELATNASLNSPAGLALDKSGSLYIADRGNHRIRKVTAEGTISTVAGGTKAGYSGDFGVATQAALKNPMAVVVDGDGSLYISDSGNNRIRKVDPSGVISTLAGTGSRRHDGDEKPAIEAGMTPSGIALDGAGGLIVADTRNHRVRLIDLESGIISTLAGTGKRGFGGDGDLAQGAKLSSPWGVAVSPAGDIFITDSGNNRVRRIDMVSGIIETIAGNGETAFSGDGGPATDAGIWSPYGLAMDKQNNLFIADYLNHRVRRINLNKGEMPEHTPRIEGGTPMWLKSGFLGVTALLVKIIWDTTRPPPELGSPPGFPEVP
jgi:DNA-binding beta-propeller fold protein YncE